MGSETIFCAGCGITLMPFMKICPRCGLEREDAQPLESESSEDYREFEDNSAAFVETVSKQEAPGVSEDVKTSVIPLSAIRQKVSHFDEEEFTPSQNFVLLSPTDEKRRFPLFTRAQLTLALIGVALILVALVVSALLWRQQRKDNVQTMSSATIKSTQPTPEISPTPDPAVSPTPFDDQALVESVRTALMAYNPLGFTRYKFEVKEGVVTLSGEADHQPEKDGAETVVRLLAGVKSVVNNLQIKPGVSDSPVRLNLAEAKLLDDAMRRQLQENQQASFNPTPTPVNDAQREAERQKREQLAAKQREEEAATRRAAEEKLRREAEEYEKRLEELRRAEAERRARAEQAKIDAATLRYGTVAWSGIIDGVDEIIISGSSASVRHLNGEPPREVRASFSTPIPRSPVEVKLIWVSGRGLVDIVQQPSASNGYTTIIRIDDSVKGGNKRYEFTLRWNLL